MSLKSSVEYYKQAEYLWKEIDQTFNEFEEGKIPDIRVDTIVNKTLGDIGRLTSLLSKINVQDLEGHYDKNVIDDVKYNIGAFYEAADYIEKYLTGKKYYDSLLNGVSRFIESMSLDHGDYKKWAKDEDELAKKFTSMLLHPNNINQFINQIKRMALGTMSEKEFRKIYDTNKNKMIPILHESYGFYSFKEYKLEL